MNEDRPKSHRHSNGRTILRIGGPVVAAVGLVYVVVSFQPPLSSWCAFAGKPLIVVGLVMCLVGYQDACKRCIAGNPAHLTDDHLSDVGASDMSVVASSSCRGLKSKDDSCWATWTFRVVSRIPLGNVVRYMSKYAMRGALSGVVCCLPGLLAGLWLSSPTDGGFLWALLFSWWAPGVSYGLLVAAPMADANDRSKVVAFLASVGGYSVALWLPSWGVFESPETYPWLRDYAPGAVGATIVAAGVLPWRRDTVYAALLTAIAGAIATLAFTVEVAPRMGILQCTIGFVVWQSTTAACLSLGLIGRPSDEIL